MKAIRALVDIACIALAVIGVVIICCFAYYMLFNEDITIGVNNIGNQLAVDIDSIVKDEDLTDEQKDEYEERYFMTANYYDNSNSNGVQLQELRYDYFTSYKLTTADYRSTGMQYLGDFSTYTETVKHEDEANKRVVDDFYYYDTTNGISWSGYNGKNGSIATTLNREQAFIIKIDGRPFEIQLTGQYDTYRDKLFLGFLWKTGEVEVASTTYYDYGDVFDCVFKAIKSNNRGYGDYYVTVDLSDFFTVKEYDPESGQYKGDTVTDIIKNYAVLKFHYEGNGAIASSQSLFGIIECNSKYDLTPTDYDTTYWQERVVYTLTEKDLSLRYSEVYRGYFASLSYETKKLFATMPRAKVNVTVYTNSKYNIVGFDYNAFENFELDTVSVTGNGTFYLLDKCLYGTNLKRLERSRNVVLDIAATAIDTKYTGVTL